MYDYSLGGGCAYPPVVGEQQRSGDGARQPDEPTDFSTPIPLRGNRSVARELASQAAQYAAERPNPWTRLETANEVLGHLDQLVHELGRRWEEGADRYAVVSILALEAGHLRAALWGDVAACDAVRALPPMPFVVEGWRRLLDREDPCGRPCRHGGRVGTCTEGC